MAPMPLILASSSPYRRALLQRLALDFEVLAPDIDETPRPGESASSLAERLARCKAAAVASQRPGALVIGSDQVAECRGQHLGKPETADRAMAQLQFMRGSDVVFHTAVAVARGNRMLSEVVATRVRLRKLSDSQLSRYIEREQPLDCAGAFKSECGGIALLESLSSDDPSALVGLPLIATIRLLEAFGLSLP